MFVQECNAVDWPILFCPLDPFSVGLVSVVLDGFLELRAGWPKGNIPRIQNPVG
jgi:hypothetical protein